MEFLVNHSHTSVSNVSEGEVRDFTAYNHVSDYSDMVDTLGEEDSISIAGTEHWRINQYEDFQEYVTANGGSIDVFDTHIAGELDGTDFALFYGVEASLENAPEHVTLSGVDVSEVDADEDYINLSEDELYDMARKSSWITPAHPFLPGFSLEDENVETVLDMDRDEEIDVMVPYTAGYNPLLDRMAQGRYRDNNVEDIAEERDLPLIPESDMHCYVPNGLAGFGVTEGVVESAKEGEIDIEAIGSTDIISPGFVDSTRNTWRSIQTFADQAPGYRSGVYRNVPFVPTSEKDFEKIWENSLKNLEIDRDEVAENIRELQNPSFSSDTS